MYHSRFTLPREIYNKSICFGKILDATFDDILPLALHHMPKWTESIVRLSIREYVNLNNFEQLSKYPGPVLLIRRSQDEVICTR